MLFFRANYLQPNKFPIYSQIKQVKQIIMQINEQIKKIYIFWNKM